MKIKTSELAGAALDWAVAAAAKQAVEIRVTGRQNTGCRFGLFFNQRWVPNERWDEFTPSTDWAQGGPIIEREGIDLNFSNHDGTSGEVWDAACEAGRIFGGPTALIAAMRCFVASELGDEVEVPDGLAR